MSREYRDLSRLRTVDLIFKDGILSEFSETITGIGMAFGLVGGFELVSPEFPGHHDME